MAVPSLTSLDGRRAPKGRGSPDIPPIYLMIVFWGEEFSRMFLDFTVASLLSPNNIPAIKNKRDARFLIATTQEDWDWLQTEPQFRKLASLIRPVLVDLGDRYIYWKYHKMGYGHRLLTAEAMKAEAIGIHTNPDTVMPDGAVAECQRLAEEGKHLVVCQAVRFEMEGVLADLRAGNHFRTDGTIHVPMRAAAAIGVRNFHIETKAGNWDSPNFGQLHPQHQVDHFPICVYFEVPDEQGVVMFGHNWAPVMMNYSAIRKHDSSSLGTWTIDGDYAFANYPDARVGKELHVVRDSDELFLLGMTPKNDMAFQFEWSWWKCPPVLGTWSKGYLINRVQFIHWLDKRRHGIYPLFARWHGGVNRRERWDETERRGMAIVEAYRKFDMHPRRGLGACRSSMERLAFVMRVGLLRFLWYALLFWNGMPGVLDDKNEKNHEIPDSSLRRRLMKRARIAMGRAYLNWRPSRGDRTTVGRSDPPLGATSEAG